MTSKPILLHFANVFANRVATLDQHTLDKSTRGNKHVVLTTKIDDVSHCAFQHYRERTAGKLERVNVRAHCFERIFQITSTDDGIIRSPHFCSPALPVWLRAR